MFKRDTVLIWLGILMLSGLFLMGQDAWAPCVDVDKDGYGSASIESCPNTGWDCNDSEAGINPGAAEILDNGVDENCDGFDATNADKAMLLAFKTDNDELMSTFLALDPTPGPGTDETVYGSNGGSCQWTVIPGLTPDITYDYQAYDETGLEINGKWDGQMSLGFIWILDGNLEFSGTYNGWIYYQMPMDRDGMPNLTARTWNVCNYDDGCTNALGVTAGTAFFTNADMN